MKTLRRLFLFAMAAGMLFACTKEADELFFADKTGPGLKKAPIVNPASGLDQQRFVTIFGLLMLKQSYDLENETVMERRK